MIKLSSNLDTAKRRNKGIKQLIVNTLTLTIREQNFR